MTGVSQAGRVQIHVFPAYRRSVSQQWLRRLVATALEMAEPPEASAGGSPFYTGQGAPPAGTGPGRWEVEVVLANDETVRRLNRDYRGLDEITDVLAFSPSHSGHYEGADSPPTVEADPFVTPETGFHSLGQVVVAYPQARRQAKQAGHPVRQEVALLVVHGLLHLLRYDHMATEGERAMQAQEAAILARVLSGQKTGLQ